MVSVKHDNTRSENNFDRKVVKEIPILFVYPNCATYSKVTSTPYRTKSRCGRCGGCHVFSTSHRKYIL